ncbi:hypothetical protein S83_017761 [Arachis hypogaea]
MGTSGLNPLKLSVACGMNWRGIVEFLTQLWGVIVLSLVFQLNWVGLGKMILLLLTMEVLFELGGFEIVRGVFISLAPPYTPHPDLVNTSSMIASLRAVGNKAPRSWYFPYDFATAVLCDAPIEEIQQKYEGRWMPKTRDLEHVFVPIWEPADTWYLMLLDVKASKIYALDVSRSPESIVRRESNMNKILLALGKMFIQSRNIVNFRHTSPDPSNWGNFIYPDGLPKDLQSAVSGLWCLSWLQHKGGFSTKIFRHIGNSDEVRMRAALHVVQSDINRHRAFVQSKAEVVWQGITTSHQKETFNNEGM